MLRKKLPTLVLLCAAFGFYYSTGHDVKAQSPEKAEIVVRVLNVREGPSLSKPTIAQVAGGDTVTVLKERYGWLKISLDDGKTGWIAGQFTVKKAGHSSTSGTDTTQTKSTVPTGKGQAVTLLNNGTNLRSGPGTDYRIVARGNSGDRFHIIEKAGSWYHIQLPDGKDAFVAGWLTVASGHEEAALNGKTIVIDPGHGGHDNGTSKGGVLEKNLTLRTAEELAEKLRKTGARVILTRKSDEYLSLQGRVETAKQDGADAFISLHYNSFPSPNVNGVTSYYYTRAKDQPLALAIQQMLVKETDRDNRGVRFANYHVLRENTQPATLLELGFLTNPWEEHVVQTSAYQDNVTTAIVEGIENYFNQQ